MKNEDRIIAVKKKLPLIKSEPISGYDRIYTLNGFSLLERPFYKYLPMTRMVQMIEDKQLVFVDPSTWKDPFEKIYATVDCSGHNYNERKDIACMCVTYSANKNEEASWKMYASSSTEGLSGTDAVRISINKDAFLSLLEGYARKNDCKVYIGNVIYVLSSDEIKGLYKKASPYHEHFCPDEMKIEHVLSMLLLKRGAYEYENEIRIFIIRDCLEKEGGLLKIPCDYKTSKLIATLTLPPNEPVGKSQKEYIKKYAKKINDSRTALNKEMFCDLLGIEKSKVKQSHLYENKRPITKIE